MLRVLSTRASTKVRSTASWCLRVWVGSVRAGAAAITAPVRTTTCATTVGTAARARWVRTTTRRGSSRPQGFTPSGRGLAFFRKPASPQEPPGFAPAVFAFWNGRLGLGQSREFRAFGACHGGIALLQDRLADEAFGLRQSGRLAQLVEQLTLNQRVVGSIPTAPTIHSGLKLHRSNEPAFGGLFDVHDSGCKLRAGERSVGSKGLMRRLRSAASFFKMSTMIGSRSPLSRSASVPMLIAATA